MKLSITWRIFIGLMLGVCVGYAIHASFDSNNPADQATLETWSKNLQLISKVFLRMIKMIIGPLVFSMLVVGIAKLGDFKLVGRIGGKTIGYFLFATVLSLLTGLITVNILKPGKVMQLPLPKSGVETGIVAKKFSLETFLYHVFPESIIESMATNEILQIVVFSIFFGIATAAIGDMGKVVVKALDAVAHVMFKIVNYVMGFAPYGVFGAIAAVVATQGPGIFVGYAYLIFSFFLGLSFFVFGVLWVICIVNKIPYFKLLGLVKDAAILTFSTASSEASMPQTIQALKKFGCSEKIISFVLPLGYSFNLDGSMMYMTFATAFIAQAYGKDLSTVQQLTMMATLMLSSKGIAGVPRASLVIIAGTMTMFDLPIEGLALLLGIDQILDMGRSATSVIGNAVATAIISKWEGELNLDQVYSEEELTI
ncbi:MAG: dicarboxylate/amino acid:cation symporter [Siphonobacter sp.]